MVGSLRRGNQNLIDTDVEGHTGYRIDQVASNATKWLTTNPPDVVILHTGGNDVFQNYRLADAPQRLNALINQIRDKSPKGVKIVVFTLLDTSDKNYVQRVTEYNAALRKVVATQYAANKDIWLAEMEGMINIKTDLYDRQHPNAKGYAKMAVACAKALSNFMPELKTINLQ
jgi:lysophospholipase L1-like esterase